MNWQYIIDAVLALILVALTRYAVPALQQYISSKKQTGLLETVDQLVAAAEQLFPSEKSGAQKLAYVQRMLGEKGVKPDDSTRAAIESAVFRLPKKGGSTDD